MKISEILSKEFKTAPTLSEFVDFTCNEKFYLKFARTLEEKDKYNNTFEEKTLYFIQEYNNFLKQPIELKMLVPCKDGEAFNMSKHGLKEDFQKAKEDVLFNIENENKQILLHYGAVIDFKDLDKCTFDDFTKEKITENYFKFLDK